jgi:hypothetical protein
VLKLEINIGALERGHYAMQRFPDLLLAELKTANRDTSAIVLRRIKLKLSNEVLHVRTGNLRRNWSIKSPVPLATGTGWSGGVGTKIEYAAYHEFGFHGTQSVRAHTRAQAARGGAGRKGASTGTVSVRAHSRTVNYPGHPYARPSLGESQPDAKATHVSAIERAEARFRSRT